MAWCGGWCPARVLGHRSHILGHVLQGYPAQAAAGAGKNWSFACFKRLFSWAQVRVRENAEAVAFYRGEEDEKTLLSQVGCLHAFLCGRLFV